MAKSAAIDSFLKFYKNFDVSSDILFNKVYDKKIIFEDPFHKVIGRKDVFNYFVRIMEKVPECTFEIFDVGVIEGQGAKENSAMITWVMKFKHNMLNSGKEISVNGVSHIKFREKVTYHRDYFDSGQLIYKNIPLLGSIIRFFEKGM